MAETHDIPPSSRLIDAEGKVIETLMESDTSKFDSLGLKRVELLRFPAADGKTELFGLLHKPSNFDPSKKYPLLVSVYAGPETNGARETFATTRTDQLSDRASASSSPRSTPGAPRVEARSSSTRSTSSSA